MNIRPFTGWLWVLLSGVIGILLGAYLWANMPLAPNGCSASCSASS